jgi:hypothetical protein
MDCYEQPALPLNQSVFQRSGDRFASRKRVKTRIEPRSDFIGTEKALDARIGQDGRI